MKKEKRISYSEGALMLSVAGLYDAASAVLFLNIVIVPVWWLHFWLWFRLRGVSIGFGSPKRVLTTGFGALIEVIPALSIAPSYVVVVGVILAFTWAEDRVGIVIPTTSPKKIAAKGGRGKSKQPARAAQRTPPPMADVVKPTQTRERPQLIPKRAT